MPPNLQGQEEVEAQQRLDLERRLEKVLRDLFEEAKFLEVIDLEEGEWSYTNAA